MGVEFAGLTWGRPEAWWGLLAPVAILLFARRPLRPRTVATGALSLWRRVQESSRGGDGERPQVPPGLWWLCAGLIVGVLAMAGPRERTPGSTRSWSVLVDRSPIAHLPVASGGKTRLARAVELLEEEWRDLVHDGDRVRWYDGSEWVESEHFPEAWSEAPRAPMQPPEWARWDAPGAVWVCARAPDSTRLEASLCASGGEAAPGPVAVDGEDRLDWSGDGLVRVVGGAPRRSVRVVDLRGDLAAFIELWADERGLVMNKGGPSADDVLVVSQRAPGSGGLATNDGSGSARAGVLSLGPSEGALLGTDPAAFALFWSERLDELCLPVTGLSPVAGRAPIGKAMWIAGRAPDERRDGGPPGRAWEGLLALLSCGLVAVALVGFPR